MDAQTRFRSAQSVVRRKIEDLDEAQRAPPCSLCKYRVERGEMGKFFCAHPVYTDVECDPVAGKVTPKHRTPAATARMVTGYCGPEASLFEKRGFFARYWPYMFFGSPLAFAIISDLHRWL